MSLANILGQEQAVEVFKNILSHGRLGHSYIFAGPAGVGKFLFAKELAKYLLCEKGSGCQDCRACLQVDHLTHPSLRIIKTAGKEKYIPIERVREMEQEIRLKPFIGRPTGSPGGRYKIFIIDNADLLSDPASNALLKTLEEPPPYSLLILVTARTEALLSTVYSRCQVIRFRAIRPEILVKFFKDKFALTQAQAQVLVGLSDGSIGQGCYFIEKGLLAQRDILIEKLLHSQPTNSNIVVEELVNYAKRNSRNKMEIRARVIQQFKIIALFLRDVLLLTEGLKEKDLLFNQDKVNELRCERDYFSRPALVKSLESFLLAEEYIRANANINLVVTQTIMPLMNN